MIPGFVLWVLRLASGMCQCLNNVDQKNGQRISGTDIVFTVSPFNFTAIASNLNMAPVMMGNTTVWKPATTSLLSNYILMQIYMEAGLPDGVINFIFVHPTANAREVAVNAFRGAFEYQGQKCSAVSRMYVPASLRQPVLDLLLEFGESAAMGDVTDANNFINAVIDESSFNNIAGYLDYIKAAPDARIIIGGHCDKSTGYFVEPTIAVTTNPRFRTLEEEIFGPVLTIYVYEDSKLDETIELCNATSPYGLTGAVFAHDRVAASNICEQLQYAAGNFYINDKPTGAIVGLQPFGGSRASGTNDKAGGEFNLIRWVSPRTIKETFLPATDYRYEYMK